MAVLYALIALFLLVFLLLCMPVYIDVKYSEQLELKINYLFIPVFKVPKPVRRAGRLSVFLDRIGRTVCGLFKKIKPKKKKKSVARDESSSKKAQKKGGFSELIEQRGFWGAMELIKRIVGVACGAFKKILRGVTVRRFDMQAVIGGEDAADTALTYGKICAALYPALGIFFANVRKYKKNISVKPDFSAADSTVSIAADFKVYPILVAVHAFGAALRLLMSEIKTQISNSTAEKTAENNNI